MAGDAGAGRRGCGGAPHFPLSFAVNLKLLKNKVWVFFFFLNHEFSKLDFHKPLTLGTDSNTSRRFIQLTNFIQQFLS